MSLSQDLNWKDSIDPYLDNIMPLNDEPEVSSLEYKSKRVWSTGVTSIKPQKCASVQENAAITAAEGMNTLASSMVAPQLTCFDQCMEILKEMESDDEITSTNLFHISCAIMKESEH